MHGAAGAQPYADESVPVHADIGRDHPMVVFGDHRLCVGRTLEVRPMPGPHMHSQVELNFVLSGAMEYWFDGLPARLGAGELGLFWGMVPHQVTRTAGETRFVCLYVPLSALLPQRGLRGLTDAVLGGALLRARETLPQEGGMFLRWREELLSSDERLQELVRDEVILRLRRLEHQGWRDLRQEVQAARPGGPRGPARNRAVESMVRFIGEHGRSPIGVAEVARAAGLHPNYAMQLFRRTMGMSVKQAIIRQRLDAAQSMLIASDRAITEIAFACGFGSLSGFYECFARRFATSPTQFRRALVQRGAAGAAG